MKAEPVSLKEAVARAHAGEDVSYLRVRAEGKFDNTKERYFFTVSDGTPGWHVITPLETPDGETVLVDRGFVPDALQRAVVEAAGRTERRRHRDRLGAASRNPRPVRPR